MLRRRLWQLALLATDIVSLTIAFAAAFNLRIQLRWPTPLDSADQYGTVLPVVLVFWAVVFAATGLYDINQKLFVDEAYYVGRGVTLAAVLSMAVTFATRRYVYSRLILVLAWGLSMVVVSGLRGLVRWLLSQLAWFRMKIVVLGANETGRLFARQLGRSRIRASEIIAFLGDAEPIPVSSLEGIPVLGSITDARLRQLRKQADEVVVALPSAPRDRLLELLEQCEAAGFPEIKVIPDFHGIATVRASLTDIGGVVLVRLRANVLVGVSRIMKRAMDIIGAGFVLVLASPVMLAAAVAIRLDSPGPVFFAQRRAGEHGKEFTMLKFRSMYQDAEARLHDLLAQNEKSGPMFKIRDDPRITRVGKILRITSIDELPQLFNVLLGDMSLVGPRPPLPREVAEYSEKHLRRLEAKPGITGLWQVSGRSDLEFEEMVDLDLFYIRNWTLWLDIKILLRTVPVVLFGDGAY